MINVTKTHPYTLNKGEQVWALPSGRRYIVMTIRDGKSSHQGNEVFRLLATELDVQGLPAVRTDGKIARDQVGHYVSHMSHNPDANLRSTMMEALETYLGNMDRASQAHTDLDDLSDWIVGHEEAAYLPDALNHLTCP